MKLYFLYKKKNEHDNQVQGNSTSGLSMSPEKAREENESKNTLIRYNTQYNMKNSKARA